MAEVPFPRQYVLHMGKGGYGPTLPTTTPTPRGVRMSAADTNMNYCRAGNLGLALMFSRGGFLTPSTQTRPDEKTLWAVPLYKCKMVIHHPDGEACESVLANLAASQWRLPGMQFALKWGWTYTLQYEDREVTGDVIHIKADLFVAAGEDPEAPDSPPAFRRHNGHPVNFYGTAARLAAMSEVLSNSDLPTVLY